MNNKINIKHHPEFDIKKVIKHYEEKDGVPITYVCTTDLSASDNPIDIFFEDVPENQHAAPLPIAILLDPDVLVHKA